MGKKLYTKENISKAETEWLGIPELVVLKTNRDDVGLEVVHRRYFEDEKLLCPACRSSRTRCSKIVDRKLKDLLWLDEDHKTFQIISLLFHQRYMRCDSCGQSVFPEPTEFGEKGCKFTNRLSDALADGTFQFSYKKVCQHYGVPASTASVGEVMRRRIQYRESLLPPIRTPHIISIVEVVFFGEFYPAVLGIWDGEVYCLDILRDSSEETCGAFLKTLDANQVETIYVDPVDSLFNAVNQYFPMASIVVTDEAIQRYARNAMLDIIHSDGKRFPVVHKDRRLTVLHKDLDDRTVIPRIKEGMKSRPRLQQAYNHHQRLLELMETKWSMEDLRTWADQIPTEVDEFLAVGDIIDIFGEQLSGFLTLGEKPPNNYQFAVQGICDAIKDMPHCIFDVMRGRCIFSITHDTMEENGELWRYGITADNADMNPEKISAIDMGYVFENLVQRFSESYDEEAGAHFTSRDIIYLMCDLLTMNADFSGEDAPAKTVYDMAMGTSQMLTCMEERVHALDKEAEIICYGQEINPFTFGIAKADMLIRGGDPENMQFGDTLNADKFKGYTFDYIISNPPFGIDWKREAADVEKEHKLGDAGRFGVGLPQKSDGQMLFLLNGIAKLKDTGRMAIIQNGSSLFTGDAGSGPSEIRRYIIENDWLDAIVQLPNDSFYNTGIATYVWIVSKNKPETHRERILLIDASKCCEARRRPIGNKRVDITESCRNLITQAYSEYRSAIFTKTLEDKKTVLTCKSKVLDAISLGYNKITVESPALDDDGNPIVKKGKPVADTSKRDTESVPLDEDVDAYFAREVLPYRPGAWIDKSKTKVGYEIPFTRTFYEYEELEPAADIAERIAAREKVLMEKLQALFGNGGGQNE